MDSQSETYIYLDTSSSLNIRNISAVRDHILSKMQSNGNIIIEIPAAAEVDLSFVQLLEATRIQSKASGGSLALSAPATGSVLDVLRRGGFLDGMSREDAQFWLHDEVLQ